MILNIRIFAVWHKIMHETHAQEARCAAGIRAYASIAQSPGLLVVVCIMPDRSRLSAVNQ